MKLTNKLPRWLSIGFIYPVLFLNGWLFVLAFEYFKSPITIFITANLLAFVLDYPVNFLKRCGMRRNFAILLVFLITFLLLTVLAIIIVPILIKQLTDLAEYLPSWIESGRQQLTHLSEWAIAWKLPINISGLATQIADRLSQQLQTLVGEVVHWVVGTVGSVLNVVLTLVLTFYLVLHSEKVWDGIFQWIPSSYSNRLREALRQNFHNYFVGQATIASLMGILMTVAFLILQVPFGLLFGLGVGIMALVPFGCALSIAIVSFLTGLKSIWLGVRVLIVATIIEQVIENGFAPRLLGGFTGLNPVWVLFSLIVGAHLAGLLGLVVAVPLASCFKSLVSILLEKRNGTADMRMENGEF
ncbi:AI-2E family transporter [Limnofasciculus baicalensis]|uniref:AI-2E family transporter n=1 Tax=Limnofasciculus baicalensis BBK-W-15 TaxID=2699891 RepID=A0AAE3KQP0_9CYAN|nr:AI-2E family transporter [Limnofasciculus baicalensis]MCP2732046.1 AI-2E family transporter [Limnofasciculus baicalensis BBK-W-15]